MDYCNTLISTLLPVLIIFSDPIASDSSSASSSSEEIPKWENPFDDLISSSSDNLFKRWEDTQVSIYLEPYSKGWFPKFQNQSISDLSVGSVKYQIQILNTQTQNIFCCVNENWIIHFEYNFLSLCLFLSSCLIAVKGI